jgi:asparagine synthase (glutamine-hydrolysing)
MSGIAGLFRTDGAPVGRELIGRLTRSLAFRGPDVQRVWSDGPIAFGHTLLRTTEESESEHQPFTLDGEVWIVADARIDARAELVLKLGESPSLLRSPDVALILRAYLRWGESCVEHLLGDFAFGIWDGRTRRLFCARDHMGVKPFYYACVGPWMVFSNTLDCVRLHHAVSDKLNDLAIADFILLGFNREAATTSFADIQRLEPAHTLGCSGSRSDSAVETRRYWTLPIEDPIYYRRDREYVDQFRALLTESVSDRLRMRKVGVFMSGGLDSPALAATAKRLLPAPDSVQAFTVVFDRLIPDSERHYAGLVASHLGIPIQFFALDERTDWPIPGERVTPEPFNDSADPGARLRCHKAVAAHSRVVLYGEGPDNALSYEWRPYLAWLKNQRRWGRLLLDVVRHIRAHNRVPLLPTLIFGKRRNGAYWKPAFPEWLDPDLTERLRLHERWLAFSAAAPSPHPVMPRGYSSLRNCIWPALFEEFEPPYTGAALEVRHPFCDIRMLSFLLRVPALPWCRNKYLLRRALRGIVPESVRRRPKTPLIKHPDYERAGLHGLPETLVSPRLTAYGKPTHLLRERPESVAELYMRLRFASLSSWLHDLNSTHTMERNYEFAEETATITGV